MKVHVEVKRSNPSIVLCKIMKPAFPFERIGGVGDQIVAFNKAIESRAAKRNLYELHCICSQSRGSVIYESTLIAGGGYIYDRHFFINDKGEVCDEDEGSFLVVVWEMDYQ